MPIKSTFGHWTVPATAKVTSPVTLTSADFGTLVTNEGAVGSVTYNLPAPAAEFNGAWVEFFTVTAQAMVIGVTGNDKLIVHADVGADTVTTAATIGQHFKVICVGATGWAVISNPSVASAATAVTAVTIAT